MKLVPCKRISEAEDIGRIVASLVPDYANYITGSTLFIDGSMILKSGLCREQLAGAWVGGLPEVDIRSRSRRLTLVWSALTAYAY
jgi:hypothetical protein